MSNNKKILSTIALIVIIILLAFFVWKQTKQTETSIDTNISIESTEDVDVATTTTSVKPVTISYQKALEIYKDKRIQLGATTVCTATPNNVTYKNGTSIMIDNRSTIARTIKIGSTYTVKPYGFKIIKLTSKTLPVKWYMDCNKQQNVATILLQK
ncbi:MAG: hypothetical protein WCO58_02255 [bacterium]